MQTSKASTPFFVVILSSIVFAAPLSKAPVVSKPASGQSQSGYARRAVTISDELKPNLADFWATFDKMEDLHSLMQKHTKRDGDATGTDKIEWNKQKTVLLSVIQNIRSNTKRLRAISPVPRSLKKVDGSLVSASFEMEMGLDSVMSWVQTPSPEMKLQLGRQLRKGITTWSGALISLNRIIDPAVKTKVYLDD